MQPEIGVAKFVSMTKQQVTLIALAAVLFGVLYFGCDTKPKTHQQIEERRALNSESTSVSALLSDAKQKLEPAQANAILALETQLQNVEVDSSKIEILKLLSGRWFEFGYPAIAGSYAQKVAEELENNEDSWSIAGTTYTICVQRSQEDKIKQFCTDRAKQSFESALSLNPNSVQHQTNLALLFAENPPQENPMKGILMLLDLNKKYPEDVGVLVNLGRLGIQTNQLDKAVQRLEKAISIAPDDPRANCYLAEVYQKLGNTEKASFFQANCDALARQ